MNAADSSDAKGTKGRQTGGDGRLNIRIFFWSLTSALAGFLFGFDTVVISGAEQKIQSLWSLSDGMHGIAMASALYGTVLVHFWVDGPPIALGAKPLCS